MTTDLDNDLRRAFARAADLAPDAIPEWSSQPRVGLVVSEGPKRTHRPTTARVLAGALAAAASVALVVMVTNRRDPAVDEPLSPPAVLQPSAHSDRIDAWPIVEWAGPGTLLANYGIVDGDQGWGGAVGAVGADGLPSEVMEVSVFPVGHDVTFPDTQPGRVAGVGETAFGDGKYALSWLDGNVPFTLLGDNLDMMYEVVGHVLPAAGDVGYEIAGELPGGLSVLEPPRRRLAMRTPSVTSADGSGAFALSVEDGPVLTWLADVPKPQPITVDGLHGYRSTRGKPIIVLALSTDETLWISSNTMAFDELKNVAGRVQLVDEVTFRAKYNVTD